MSIFTRNEKKSAPQGLSLEMSRVDARISPPVPPKNPADSVSDNELVGIDELAINELALYVRMDGVDDWSFHRYFENLESAKKMIPTLFDRFDHVELRQSVYYESRYFRRPPPPAALGYGGSVSVADQSTPLFSGAESAVKRLNPHLAGHGETMRIHGSNTVPDDRARNISISSRTVSALIALLANHDSYNNELPRAATGIHSPLFDYKDYGKITGLAGQHLGETMDSLIKSKLIESHRKVNRPNTGKPRYSYFLTKEGVETARLLSE